MEPTDIVIYMYQEYKMSFLSYEKNPGLFYVVITRASEVEEIKNNPIWGNKGHVMPGTEKILNLGSIDPHRVAEEYINQISIREVEPVDAPSVQWKPFFRRCIAYQPEIKATVEERVNKLFEQLKVKT